MNFLKTSLTVFALCASALSAISQEKAPEATVKISTDKPDAIYQQADPVKFGVLFMENSQPVKGKKLNYTLSGDGLVTKEGIIETSEEPQSIPAKIEKPGFILLKASFESEDKKAITGLGGAAIDPLKIKAVVTEPEDFDKFWAEKKAELTKIPMNPKLVPSDVPDEKKGAFECFDVKLDCTDGVPVSGYLIKPLNAKKGSLPVIVTYHGAGVRSARKEFDIAAKTGAIVFDINAHGIENGKDEEFYQELKQGKLKRYQLKGSDNKDKMYFKGMFQRVLRALEFAKSLPEWDGKTLISYGGSQGGSQSLVAAALDKDVTFCVAFVPGMGDHFGLLKDQQSGWPRFIKLKDGKPENQDIADAARYYDMAIFAKKIKADVLMSVGFVDTTCPPTTVYAIYNNISSKKEIMNNPLAGHNIPVANTDYAVKKIVEHIKSKTAGK